MKFKANRIIDGKSKWIVVDKYGMIIDRSPNKEELRDLESEFYIGKRYTDEELLKFLIQFDEENGKPPIGRDFANNPKYPC
jgi:hypothetical protein